MTELEAFEKLKDCLDFLRDNLTVDNVGLVYEFACLRFGYVVVSAAAIILFAASKGENKNG